MTNKQSHKGGAEMTNAIEVNAKGVVALFIDDKGNVIASSDDFARARYGGFSLREAQQMRAKERLPSLVVQAYCSHQFARGVSNYHARGIIEDLVSNHGCKIEIIYIGHEAQS